MKNLLIAGLLIAAVVLGINATTQEQNTESYAIVNVVEKAQRLIVRITKDGKTEVKNIESGFVDGEDMPNFEPIVKIMIDLNNEGYELMNGSVSSIVYGNTKRGVSRPYHSFIFVKK